MTDPNIIIVNDCPPIPTRKFDWSAYVDGSIDVCGDPECGCHSTVVVGRGATEQEAIEDLKRQMEERDG